MRPLHHDVFGTIDREPAERTEVVWETYIELDPSAEPVAVALWTSPGAVVDPDVLDRYAAVLARLDEHDAAARPRLREALEADDAYLAFHRDEAEPRPEALDAIDGDVTVAAFVDRLVLVGVDLSSTAEPGLVLDYMIDPESGDEALSVTCDADGAVLDVAWDR